MLTRTFPFSIILLYKMEIKKKGAILNEDY